MEKHAISTLRAASQYAYASLGLPYTEDFSFDPQQVFRTGPLPQWLIERENFERDVASGFKNLIPGQPRQLVAGTGVGKSTKLPLVVATNSEGIGIVIFPENTMAYFTQAYVKANLVANYNGIQTAVLRSGHFAAPLSAPALYYTSGADLLCHMASKKSALQKLGVTFMYLDESHCDRPDYKVFQKLCRTSLMPKIKLFYGSATVASDATMESGGVGRAIVKKPPSHFPIKSPNNVHASSPMHYMSITKKTLVFVPTDTDVLNWVDYYKKHDVKTLYVLDADGTNTLARMILDCSRYECFVLVCTARLECSYTMDIDVVIDTGYKQRLQYSEDCASCELVVTPVTRDERVQRAGRVGRHKSGTVYQCDIEPHPNLDPNRLEITFYEYLWYKVFSIEVNDPSIVRFDELTGGLSRVAAALLLNTKVPALLALPYVGNRGFYRGFEKVLTLMSCSQTEITDGEDIVERALEWPEYSAGSYIWVEGEPEYKCAIQFPKNWNVVPYVLWKTYQDQQFVKKYKFNMDNRSVISAVSNRTIRPQLERSDTFRDLRPEPKKLAQNRPVLSFDDMKSVIGARSTVSPEQFKRAMSPTYEHEPLPTFQSVSNSARFSTVSKRENEKQPTVVSQSVHGSNIDRWVRHQMEYPTSPPSSNSSGHKSRDEIKLVKVDPAKYKYYKFYPLDADLYRQFEDTDGYLSEKTIKKDMRNVDRLVYGESFASLSGEEKSKYYLSVLRVHNHRVSAKLQMKASNNPSYAQYLTIAMKSMQITTSEELITATVSLLKAMEFDRYYVAIDKRSMQSTESAKTHSRGSSGSEVQRSPTFTDEQTKAAIALAFGDDKVQDLVYSILNNVMKLEVHGAKVANYLWCGATIFMAEHTYQEYKENLPFHTLKEKPYDADLVQLEVVETKLDRLLRKPVDGEQVYALAHSTVTSQAVVYGFYTMVDNGGIWLVDYAFDYGYSGATIVSAKDGAILAIYCGRYADADGIQYGRVEPLIN